ncbi:hypothetical protein KXV95_001989 [Aspergillus fumigatus]|nr:hypothetical protein KXX45_005347 [Aspergillus fumigatus]KAH1269379.1 hypothetical protein KXX30_006594 [Aspergillus fumigatus]KAH1367326.1 hypothetical protein KXX63_001883 [Aspergillus fumigatus]KAH1386383.1 hypothetical protein KXX10_003960 [Aspergillus fumigatus]KAH1406153.1 hypothetical protein KXX51_008318 [Aspergillus fumigatus]
MKPSSSKVRKPDRRLLVATGKMVQFKHATLTFQLFYVMFSGCMIGGSLWGTGKHLVDLTPEHRARAMEYWFLCDIGYAIASILCKISVAIFLLRVMVHPFHRRIMYAVTALTVIVGIIFFVYMMIQCSPVSYFWTRMLGNTSGKCGYVDAIIILLYLFSASSALFDLTVGLLPILLVRNLQMNQRTKIAVAGLLGMACIASVAIIIRIPFVQTIRAPDFLYATVQIAIWSNIETGLGITAGSLATARPLFRVLQSRRRQHQFPLGDLESNTWRSPYDPTKSNSQDDRHGITISAETSGASEFMTESTEQLDGKLPSVPMPSLSKIGVRRTFEISTSQAG